MRRLVLLLVLVTACSQVAPARPPRSVPRMTAPSTTAPSIHSLVRFDSVGDRPGALLRRVHPRTLKDSSGFQPISFGENSTTALSPDGALLAVAVEARTGEWPLYVVDLRAWGIRDTGVSLEAAPSWLTFTPDGLSLVFVQATELQRLELGAGAPESLGSLPSGWESFGQLQPLPSGKVALYVTAQADDQALAWPRLLVVDPTGTKELELEGLWHGASADLEEHQEIFPALAWDLDGSLLYVVHADQGLVTMVDLERVQVIRQGEVRRAQAAVDRLLGWLVRPAQAKGLVPGASKRAELSPDGSRLFVTGTRTEASQDAEGRRHVTEVPLGLQVIDTATLFEVARTELPINHLALSPDGGALLASGHRSEELPDGGWDSQGFGLYLLDPQSLEVRAHLEAEAGFWFDGFSSDGRYAYVSKIDGPGNTLVVDLTAAEIVAKRPGWVEILPGTSVVWQWQEPSSVGAPLCVTCLGSPWPFELPSGYYVEGDQVRRGKPEPGPPPGTS